MLKCFLQTASGLVRFVRHRESFELFGYFSSRDPYTVTTATSYDFPENYSAYLGELRDMVQNNRKKLQTIKKEWKDNHKETITVYGTVLRGKLCKCEFGGDRYITTGDQISFPTGEYELIENYWTEDKYNILFYDFAEFEYGNTDYRTNK